MTTACSFSKKNIPIIPQDQNSHQTMTRFGCVGFSMYAFFAPKATILLVYIPANIKMNFIWKDNFFPKSASSVSRSQADLAKRKLIGWSIDFNSWTNWTLYSVILRSLCTIRLNDVSYMLNCYERRWIDVDEVSHTPSATAAIFSSVRTVFGYSRFDLWMRMPVSFTFSTR